MKKINQAARAELMGRVKAGDRGAVEPLAALYEAAGLKTLAASVRLALKSDAAWVRFQAAAREAF